MTQYNPFLKLNRLVIFAHDGKVAYNETFHDGINIIRGNNSSGKSTIGNFIFFVLGGDFKKWTTAALYCKDVYAEIFINSEPAAQTIPSIVSLSPIFKYSGGAKLEPLWHKMTSSSQRQSLSLFRPQTGQGLFLFDASISSKPLIFNNFLDFF